MPHLTKPDYGSFIRFVFGFYSLVAGRVFEAVIVIADSDNMAMTGQLTERCRRHFFIIKDTKPFNKTQITCVRIDMERQPKPDKRQRPSEIVLLDCHNI